MSAHMLLVHDSEREDVLVIRGMRHADNTFIPGLEEVGRLFGVSIDYLPESGFTPEYIVKPPISKERIQEFAEAVIGIAVESLLVSSLPAVSFSYKPDPEARFVQAVADEMSLIA